MATLNNIILYRNNVPIGYLGSTGNPIRTAQWANSINNTYINVSNIPNLYGQNYSPTSYYEFGDIPPVIRFEGFTGYYGSAKIKTVAVISYLSCNRTSAYYPEEQTLSFNGMSAQQSINVRTYSDTNYSIYTVSGKINQSDGGFIQDSLYKVNKPQYFYWGSNQTFISMYRTLLFPENNSYDVNYATTYSEKFFSFGTTAAETSCYISYNNTNYTSQALQFNLNVGESVAVSVIPCFVNTTFKNASLTTWISTYSLNVTYTCKKNNNNVSVTTNNGVLTIKGVTPGTTKISKVGINDIYGVYGDNLLCHSSSITTNITITVASLNSSISQANITKTYGDAAFTITPSRTGVSSLRWSLSKTGVVSLSATTGNSVTATIQGAGTVTVTLSGTASSGYNAPSNKTFTITVNRKAHTITFSPTTKTVTYGDKTVYKVSVTSTIPTGTSISWATNNSSVAKITAGSTTSEVSIQPQNAGTARVTPTVTNSNYSFTISSQYHTLTVNKANATIYAPANINAYIGSNFSINTYTTPSGQYEISSYYNSGYVLLPSSGTNVSNQYYLGIGGTGACYFTAPNIINTFTVKFRSYLNSNNYNETGFVTTNVTIIKYNSGITYGSLPSNPVWGAQYTISYSLTGSTNVAVTTSVKQGSASVSTSSGNCYINASAPGWTYVQLTNPGNGTHYSSSTTIKIYFNKRSSSIVVPASSTYYGADLPTAYNGSTNRPYATIPISMTPGITTTNLNFTYSYNNTTYYSGYSYGNSNSFSCVYLYATAPGTYNGYLWFNGDNYYNATNASFTVTFNKKAATVTTSVSSVIVNYGVSGSFTVSRTGDGSLHVSKDNNNITSLKLSSGTVTFAPAAVGTSTITVKTNESTWWLSASKSVSVSVKKANTQYSNTIGASISKTFLDGKFSVTGVKVINSETGANNAVITTNNSHINWTSSNTSVATVSTAGEITIVGPGTTNITSYYPSNANYNQSNTVTNTLTVYQKQITLNALTNMSFTFGDAAKTQTASWSPAVGTLYATSNNTGVCTVSVSGTTITVTPKNSGTATITCYVAAPNGNYITSANKTFTVTVNDKGTSITTPSKITVTYYPNGNVSMSTTKSTGVGTLTWTPQTANIFNESSLTGNSVTFTMKNSTYTLTGNQVAIKISGAKTTNYAKPADVTFYVTINRYQTVITQPSNITKTYEDGQFSVTPTLSIGLTAANMKWTLSPASGTYVTASGTTGASNTFTIVKSGTTTVTLSFTSTSNDNNYITPANKSFTITVNKRNTTITNPGNKTCTYADNTISVSTTKRTGVGTLTWTPANTAVISPTKTGDSVTFNINDVGSSNVTITGVPSDSTKYNTPPAQTFSITVNKGATSLSTNITSSTVWLYHPSNSKTVTISTTLTSTPVNRITASDIALITWSSSNTNIATVSSSTGGSVTVTAVKGGTCTIKCKFPGTTKFNASSEVSVSITVNEYHPYTLSLSYSGITVNGKYINTAETNSITIAVSPSYLLAAIGNSISASSGTTTVVSTLTKTLTNSNTKCNYACTITANAGVSKITIKTTDLWNGNSFHPGTSTTVYITNLNEIKPSGTRAIRIANNNYLSQQYSVTVSSNSNANYCPTKSQINGLSLIRVMDNILTDNQLVPESYIYKIVTDNNFYSGNNYTPVYTTK